MSKRDVLRILEGDFRQAEGRLCNTKVTKEEMQAYHDVVDAYDTFVTHKVKEDQAKIDKLKARAKKLNAQIEAATNELTNSKVKAGVAFFDTPMSGNATLDSGIHTNERYSNKGLVDYILIDGVIYDEARSAIYNMKYYADKDKRAKLRAQFNKIERAIYLEGTKAEIKSLITEFDAFIKGLND